MPKAVWKGRVLAESDQTVEVDGYTYFPPEAVRTEYLIPSETTSVCQWKGVASYYHVKVDSDINPDAAWSYRSPKPEAAHIQNWIAFWRGIEIR